METCRMDKPSHFNLGQHTLDGNYNFSEITNSESQAAAVSLYPYDKNHSQLSQNVSNRYEEYEKLGSENVECKQEIDLLSFSNNIHQNENSNYGSENEFNEPYQYDYNEVSPSYSNDVNSTTMSSSTNQSLRKSNNAQQHRLDPYHISSSSKNQLPSWFLPNHPPNYSTQPSFFQHQYPYHQGNIMGGQQAPVEHNMRNMIQLSSRYYFKVPFLKTSARIMSKFIYYSTNSCLIYKVLSIIDNKLCGKN